MSEKRDPGQDEALWASSSGNSGEPSAASRVCDERFGKNRRTALDPAPGSQKPSVSLDNADAVIEGCPRAPGVFTPMESGHLGIFSSSRCLLAPGTFPQVVAIPSNNYCNSIIDVVLFGMNSRYFTLRPSRRVEGSSAISVIPNPRPSSPTSLECADSQAQPCNPIRMNTYTNAALKTLWNQHLQKNWGPGALFHSLSAARLRSMIHSRPSTVDSLFEFEARNTNHEPRSRSWSTFDFRLSTVDFSGGNPWQPREPLIQSFPAVAAPAKPLGTSRVALCPPHRPRSSPQAACSVGSVS